MTTPELIGVCTGLAGVWLTLRQNVWCFPIGIINVTVSMFLFFGQQLYADTLQQAVYIPLLIYGWVHWKQQQQNAFTPGWMSNRERAFAGLTIVVAGLLLGGLLKQFTDAHFPWADSMATAGAFVAQYLVARKKTENWLLWMGVNLAYILIYYYKGLYGYMGLFTVYFLLAVMAYRTWTKQLNAGDETR